MAKHYSGKHYPSEMDKILLEELDEYFDLCVEDIQAAQQDAAKWAVKELRNSPKTPENTGDYREGWTTEKKKFRTGAKTTIYNKTRYMLVHLLEYGHATVNGGRTKPQVHVEPVETEVGDKYMDALKRRLENES